MMKVKSLGWYKCIYSANSVKNIQAWKPSYLFAWQGEGGDEDPGTLKGASRMMMKQIIVKV